MTYTGLELAPAYPGDNTRVLQGIIAGVGFLGGGVVLRDGQDQRVRGLTGRLASAFTLLVLVAGRRIEQLLAAPLTGLNGGDHPGLRAEPAAPPAPLRSPLSPGSPPVARPSPTQGSR